MDNLKPCPFCGSADLSIEMREHRHLNTCGDWYYLRCEDCYAKVDYPSRDGLIVKWNRRPTLKPAIYPDPRDDLCFNFIEDCLRDYAAAIKDGRIEGKFTVTDILEEADMIEAIFA